MESLGIVLTVIGILVTFVIVGASMFGARKMISGMLSPLLAQQAETKRLLTVGIPCAARVLHIEQTGTSVAVMGEQSYEIRFQLEVTPPAAAGYRSMTTPYRAEMVSLVPMLALPRVQPGSVITVRADPQDPRKMAFESATAPMQAAYPAAPAAYPSAPMGGYPGGVAAHGQAHPHAAIPTGAPPAYGAAPTQGGYGHPAGWNRG